jgi:WD40 repeat protein
MGLGERPNIAHAPRSYRRGKGRGGDARWAPGRFRTLRLWDLESGEQIATFTGEDDTGSCAIASDGRTIVAGDEIGRVHILRLVEADKTKLLPGEIKIPLLHRKEQAS